MAQPLDQAAEALYLEFMEKAALLAGDDLALEHLSTMVATACLGIMRGVHGHEFARGFLQGALNDTKPPVITFTKKPGRVN